MSLSLSVRLSVCSHFSCWEYSKPPVWLKGVLRVFQFQGWSKKVFSKGVLGVSRKFQGCFMAVSGVFQGSFKGVSRKFQGSFKNASSKFKFQERFQGFSSMIDECSD